MLRVKICGITSAGDGVNAIEAGADALGLNFYPPSPRAVSLSEAREIRRAVGSNVTCVGVFVNAEPDQVRRAADEIPLDMIQLHGDEPTDLVEQLQPHRIIRAVRFRGLDAPDFQRAVRECGDGLVAAVLLDAWSAGQFGGSGQALDWSALPAAAASWKPVPWLLAGGLNPDNVARAIEQAAPTGVDVASGVESAPGIKDTHLMKRFAANARAAWPATGR